MKPIFALMALVLVFSMPAHAQAASGSAGSPHSSGGGSFGGGGVSGASGAKPAYTPTAQFQMSAVSGSNSEFVPSAYLPFDKAVALGKLLCRPTKRPSSRVAQAYKKRQGTNPGTRDRPGPTGKFCREVRSRIILASLEPRAWFRAARLR